MGRFLQSDMQGTLSPVGINMYLKRGGPNVSAPTPDVGSEYADSFNLFLYAMSDPTNLTDPFGLSFDEDIDDAIAGLYADRVAAAHHAFDQIGMLAQRAAVAVIQGMIIATVPGAGLYFAVQGVSDALEDISYNGLGWNNGLALGFSLAGTGVGGYKAIGQGMAAWSGLKRMAGSFSRSLASVKAVYGAGGASGLVRLFAEKALYGAKKHGIKWKEAAARAKKGKPQGKFGSKADVDYVVNVAKARNMKPGDSATIILPPGHTCTVTFPDGSVVTATQVWFKIRPSGAIHGFPMP